MFNPDFKHELTVGVSRILGEHLRLEREHAEEVVAETVLRLLLKKAGFLACIQGFVNVIDELEVPSSQISVHLEKAKQLFQDNPSLIQDTDRN